MTLSGKPGKVNEWKYQLTPHRSLEQLSLHSNQQEFKL